MCCDPSNQSCDFTQCTNPVPLPAALRVLWRIVEDRSKRSPFAVHGPAAPCVRWLAVHLVRRSIAHGRDDDHHAMHAKRDRRNMLLPQMDHASASRASCKCARACSAARGKVAIRTVPSGRLRPAVEALPRALGPRPLGLFAERWWGCSPGRTASPHRLRQPFRLPWRGVRRVGHPPVEYGPHRYSACLSRILLDKSARRGLTLPTAAWLNAGSCLGSRGG